MMISDRGKLQVAVKTEKEEEDEIRRLFLGIMNDYNDSVISPLSYFSQSKGSVSNNGNFSRNREMVDAKSFEQKRRRDQLSEYYSLLDSMVPNFLNSKKRTKANMLGDTVKYVKLLEEEVEMFEVLKKSRLEEPMMTDFVLSKCGYQKPVKIAFTDYAATFFAIQRPFRRALVQDIVMVLEKHQVEVLEARFSVDGQRTLTFTASIKVGSDGVSKIDRIKQEVLIL